jgi:hypothetical protein
MDEGVFGKTQFLKEWNMTFNPDDSSVGKK